MYISRRKKDGKKPYVTRFSAKIETKLDFPDKSGSLSSETLWTRNSTRKTRKKLNKPILRIVDDRIANTRMDCVECI